MRKWERKKYYRQIKKLLTMQKAFEDNGDNQSVKDLQIRIDTIAKKLDIEVVKNDKLVVEKLAMQEREEATKRYKINAIFK